MHRSFPRRSASRNWRRFAPSSRRTVAARSRWLRRTANMLFSWKGKRGQLHHKVRHGDPAGDLCGSYLRREPHVGDIDVVTLLVKSRNFAEREKEILRTKFPGTILEQIVAVELDVQRLLQHRSSLIHQVDCPEFQQLTCDYKIVHARRNQVAAHETAWASPAKLKSAFEKYRRSLAR